MFQENLNSLESKDRNEMAWVSDSETISHDWANRFVWTAFGLAVNLTATFHSESYRQFTGWWVGYLINLF